MMKTRIKPCREIAEDIDKYLGFVESAGNEDAWCDRLIERIKASASKLPEFGEE